MFIQSANVSRRVRDVEADHKGAFALAGGDLDTLDALDDGDDADHDDDPDDLDPDDNKVALEDLEQMEGPDA